MSRRRLSDIYRLAVTPARYSWQVIVLTKTGAYWRLALDKAVSPLPTDAEARRLWLESSAWKQTEGDSI
jgi:hypothetical protein